MKPSARTVLESLTRGEQISINDSRRLRCGAIGQRISELRALGIKIMDRYPTIKGERMKWKVYWIEGAAPPPKRTETVVREHRRVLAGYEEEDMQPGLFS